MSSLPGAAASRSPFVRPAAVAAVRETAPATTSSRSSENSSAAAPFSALLGAILGSNGEQRPARSMRTAADEPGKSPAGGNAGAAPDDILTLLDNAASEPSAASQPGFMTEAELQAAGIYATTMGTAGLAALSSPGDGRGSAEAGAVDSQDIEGADGASGTGHTSRLSSAVISSGASEIPTTVPSARSAAALDTIAPELRERVERVVERMRDEFGITVDVTEGYRTQARQDLLHAQGRSRPGPVVTWTRNSRHTQGRAVDVMVNGGYSDTGAFATLQRIAREEGLHTLGMRDPGHLELPASVAGSGRAATGAFSGGATAGIDLAALTQLASDAGALVESLEVDMDVPHTPARVGNGGSAAPPVAGLARVAPVATVAQVASVARVARVAVPGGRSSGRVTAEGNGGSVRGDTASNRVPGTTASVGATTSSANTFAASATDGTGATRPAVPESATASSTSLAATQLAAANGQASPEARARSAGDDRSAETHGEASANVDGNALFGGDGQRDGGGTLAAHRTSAVTGANVPDALNRIDRIDALRDGSASRPLSHLTLTLDNAAGGSDRIRVDVRGSQAGAVLELSDPVLRDRVTSNLGELQHALEQRGLQSDSLQVRRAGIGATEAQDMNSRIVGATLEREGLRAGSNANAGQSSTQQRERDGRQTPDGQPDDPSPRHRPRREPEENHK